MEPMTGIEPAPLAWEARVLPLNYIGIGDYYEKCVIRMIRT